MKLAQSLMHAHDQRNEDVAMQIGRYLRANADAADSVEGVRYGWLTHENAQVALTVVNWQFGRLISQGVVRMRVLADGTRIYSGHVKGQCEQSNDMTP
jgi:hypothetical protein